MGLQVINYGPSEGGQATPSEPASYLRLFGNVSNNGAPSAPTDVFVPTQTRDYNFINELGVSNNQVWANLGTLPGTADLANFNSSRLEDGNTRNVQVVALTAGVTYHISTAAGGGTDRSSVLVRIEAV